MGHHPPHIPLTTLFEISSPMAVKESYVDVLIIGAGPAGVMCANALIQAGVNVRIVDQRYAITPSAVASADTSVCITGRKDLKRVRRMVASHARWRFSM